MKIAKALFNILLVFVLALLAINFVRMTINGGVEGNFITFRDVMQLITDFHYNVEQAIDLVLITLNDELALVGKIGEGLSEFWSGDNILEKILSIFTVIFDYFKFIVDSLKLIYRIVGVLFTFLKAIVKLLGDLAGKVIAPLVINS